MLEPLYLIGGAAGLAAFLALEILVWGWFLHSQTKVKALERKMRQMKATHDCQELQLALLAKRLDALVAVLDDAAKGNASRPR